MAPAMADPWKFFLKLSSASAVVEDLRTVRTMWPGMVAQHTTDFPRPSTLIHRQTDTGINPPDTFSLDLADESAFKAQETDT